MSAAAQMRGQLPIYHPETALRIGYSLSTNAANLFAHVAIHHASSERHARNVVHAIADKKSRPRYRGCCRHEPINFLGKMLTVRIEKDRPRDLPIWSAGGPIVCGRTSAPSLS